MMKLTNLFVQKYKNIQASTCQIKPDTSESNLQIRGMPLPYIETSMFRLFVIFFYKLIRHCCISFTTTTGILFDAWW